MFLSKYKRMIDSLVLVLFVVALKICSILFSWEFMNINSLYTSIIAGGIFIIGFILSSIMADYKESEKLPAEIAAAVDSIHEDARYLKQQFPQFDLVSIQKKLVALLHQLGLDIPAQKTEKCLVYVSELSTSFLEMERLGTPANFIVRLKQEQSFLKKYILRIHHIQKIWFLPSSYILARSIVVLIIGLLVFTNIEPHVEGIIVTAIISYFFIFLLKLLKVIETPFHAVQPTYDDISLFLLREIRERIEKTIIES